MQIEYKKETEDNILPENRQIVLTLTTQKEIDQLTALFNFVPIRKAFETKDSSWDSIRTFLKKATINHALWHNRLLDMSWYSQKE